jgi:hypothetical protein
MSISSTLNSSVFFSLFFYLSIAALKKLRYELYQLEQFEQFMLADLKRKRKKSALQLQTPEGLDYIRISRLHDIVRCSSITTMLIYLVYQGLIYSSTSIFFSFVRKDESLNKFIFMYPFYFWTSLGIIIALLIIFILTWFFFKCWLPKATKFEKISSK